MNAPLKTFGPIKAVIFDMDGLLLDTEGIYTEVTSLIAERYGRTFDWSVKQNIIGRGANDLANYVVQALDLPITAEEFLVIREPLMRERFPTAQAMPGAARADSSPQGAQHSDRRGHQFLASVVRPENHAAPRLVRAVRLHCDGGRSGSRRGQTGAGYFPHGGPSPGCRA